jgi:hypothetical protein
VSVNAFDKGTGSVRTHCKSELKDNCINIRLLSFFDGNWMSDSLADEQSAGSGGGGELHLDEWVKEV